MSSTWELKDGNVLVVEDAESASLVVAALYTLDSYSERFAPSV